MKDNKNIIKLISTQKITEMIKKEKEALADATQKYNHFKRSASASPYYLNQSRLQNITQVYRSLTTNKLRTYTNSKSFRNKSPTRTPQKKKSPYGKPFAQSTHFNSFLDPSTKQKQKLTIQRGTQNQPTISDSNLHLSVKIKNMSAKFQDILTINSDQLFEQQFKKICLLSKGAKNDARQTKQQFINCLRLLQECCERRQSIDLDQQRKKYITIEEQINSLQIELKKKSIRAVLDQKNIQRIQNQLKQSEKELKELKDKSKIIKIDVGINTEPLKMSETEQSENVFLPNNLFTTTYNTGFIKPQSTQQNVDQSLPITYQLSECNKKLHLCKQRQSQLLSVMVILQRDGVDVEKVYSDVVSGKVSVSEQDNSQIIQSITKFKKKQNRIYHKCKNIRYDSSMDADDSIISSADGLSFNYLDKSMSQDVYTIRNEYICKQDLGQQMRDRLKLDFNILYEDMEVYDFQSEEEEIPTI